MADIGTLRVHLVAATTDFNRSLNRSLLRVQRFSKAMRRMAVVGAGVFAGMAAGAAAAAARFEQTEVAFETMLGSAEKATDLLKDLREFAKTTPFQQADVFQSTKQLMAFGVQAKDILSTLQRIGDVSAVTGKDLSELSLIYGKVLTKGKLQAEELNQFAEAGIPLIRELAKMYGVTEAEIFKMGSAGKLTFKDMEAAFKRMTGAGGMFNQGMKKQSQTLAGMWSTFRDQLTEIAIQLGQKILPILKRTLTYVNKILPQGVKGDLPEGMTAKDRERIQKERAAVMTKEMVDQYATIIAMEQSFTGTKADARKMLQGKTLKEGMELFERIAQATDEARGFKWTFKGGKREKEIVKPKLFGDDDFVDALPYEDLAQRFKEAFTMKGATTSATTQAREMEVRLASAVQAGSAEAWRLMVGGRRMQTEKVQKDNAKANQESARLLREISVGGLTINLPVVNL